MQKWYKIQLMLIISTCLLISSDIPKHIATSDPCKRKIKYFLLSPTEQSFNSLTNYSDNNSIDNCWDVITESRLRLKQLFKQTENGNQWSAKYLIMHLDNLGASDQESSAIVLGKFGDYNMEKLLYFNKTGELSAIKLNICIISTPSSLSDNFRGQMGILKRRLKKIDSIKNKDLIAQKQFCLNKLKNVIDEEFYNIK